MVREGQPNRLFRSLRLVSGVGREICVTVHNLAHCEERMDEVVFQSMRSKARAYGNAAFS